MIRAGKGRLGASKKPTAKITLGATEVAAPFTTTPTNVAERIVSYSPAGFVKAMVDFASPTTRSQKALVDDLGRAITGTGIIAFGAYLAKKGLLTGNLPENKKERDMFYAEGKQPNSIKIGNTWFSLNRISPFGNLLTLGANFHQAGETKEGLPKYATTAFAGMKGLSEMTFLKGVGGAIKAIEQPERFGQATTEQLAGSLIPSIIGRAARVKDPFLRLSDSVLDNLKSRLPYLSEQLPVRRDIFGEPVESPGGKAYIIDPFSTTKETNDSVINEAKRIGVVIGMPNQTISGIKLTDEEYSEYQRIQGKNLKNNLETLIKSPEYKKMSDQEKVEAFEYVIREVKKQIDDSIYPGLMIKRYDLPDDTNPYILKEILYQLSQTDEWKNASKKERRKLVRFNVDNNVLR